MEGRWAMAIRRRARVVMRGSGGEEQAT